MNKSIIYIIPVLVVMNSICYGQQHLVISNTRPVVGESVTFTLPTISTCPAAKASSETGWTVSPKPLADEITYGVSSITLTYKNYQPSVSVTANYVCEARKLTGSITDVITMQPPSASLVATTVPAGPCAGTTVRYKLQLPANTSATNVQLVSLLGTQGIKVLSSQNSVASEWGVLWSSSGRINVQYTLTNGTSLWQGTTNIMSFDVVPTDPRCNIRATVPATITDMNYVLTQEPLDEMMSTDDLKTIQYYDGLGRPIQKVGVRSSPLSHDMIYPTIYDQFGREVGKVLPYTSPDNDGHFHPTALAEQLAFYQGQDRSIASDPKPFSESVLDGSPLNRVVKQGSPGQAWQPDSEHPELEHVVKYQYSLNNNADSILRFNYDSRAEDIRLLSQSAPFYLTGSLYMKKTIDEDNNDVLEFTDKLDRTVCKKVRAGTNIYAYTYYVYDDIGNLSLVISPEGAKAIKSLLFNR